MKASARDTGERAMPPWMKEIGMTAHTTGVRALAGAMAAACLIALAACSPHSGSGPGEADRTAASTAQKKLDALYAGTYQDPPATAPAAQAGKKVWIISYLQAYSASAATAAAAKSAATALGWDATIFDAQANPAKAVDGIRQAVSAGANVIMTIYLDCDSIKAGLIAARDAGISRVAVESQDCASQPLFDYVVGYQPGTYAENDGSFMNWIAGWQAALADYVIATTDGAARVVEFAETDSAAVQSQHKGFTDEMGTCKGCQVLASVGFTAADMGPALQQKAQQAFLQHPDVNAVVVPADAVLTGGVLAAIKSAGLYGKVLIAGGEGGPDVMPMLKAYQGDWAVNALPVAWEGWQSMDAANRLLNGQAPIASSGIGYQIVDTDHNLPDGDQAVPTRAGKPIEFAALYQKAWGQ